MNSCIYKFPPINLLRANNESNFNEEDIRNIAINIQIYLKEKGFSVILTNCYVGPIFTTFDCHVENEISNRDMNKMSEELKIVLDVKDVRIYQLNKKEMMCVRILNAQQTDVSIREIIDTKQFILSNFQVPMAMGKDMFGEIVVEEVHNLLIIGAKSEGKTTCINSFLISVLYRKLPSEVKLMVLDYKGQLNIYNNIPHLLTEVVSEGNKMIGALNWAIFEISKRNQVFANCGVNSITNYNEMVELTNNQNQDNIEMMPYIVIVIDDLDDVIDKYGEDVYRLINRLIDKGEKTGIYIVAAVQDVALKKIPDLINIFESKIILKASLDKNELDMIGVSEEFDMLGKGDGLFVSQLLNKSLRVQCCNVVQEECVNVTNYLIANSKGNVRDEETKTGDSLYVNRIDEFVIKAGYFIIEKNSVSVGLIQRLFKIGYKRASTILNVLQQLGVIDDFQDGKTPKIIMTIDEYKDLVTGLVSGVYKYPELEEEHSAINHLDINDIEAIKPEFNFSYPKEAPKNN